MGCDIHIIGQYKGPHNRAWNTFIVPEKFSNRDYDFFGILAGVRSLEHEAISEPKGLPVDLVHTSLDDDLDTLLLNTLLDPTNEDYHSFTYHTYIDISEYIDERMEDMSYFIDGKEYEPHAAMKKLGDLKDFLRHFKVRGGDVRIVLGFDS